jgi:hypothetical protein
MKSRQSMLKFCFVFALETQGFPSYSKMPTTPTWAHISNFMTHFKKPRNSVITPF